MKMSCVGLLYGHFTSLNLLLFYWSANING